MTALAASFATVARPKFGGTSATSVARGRPVAASMRSTRSRVGGTTGSPSVTPRSNQTSRSSAIAALSIRIRASADRKSSNADPEQGREDHGLGGIDHRAVEVGRMEPQSFDLRPAQVGLFQLGAPHVRVVQVAATEDAALKIGAEEVGILEIARVELRGLEAGVGELGIALKALGDEHVVALGGLLDPEAGHATVQELDPESRQGARLQVGEIAPHEPSVAQRDRGECAVGKRDPVQDAALDGEAGRRQAIPLQLADRAAGNRYLRTTEEVVATRGGRIDGQVGAASISEFLRRLAASHRARV